MHKAPVGSTVHFFDAKIQSKMGWHNGYGGRGAGPYAALVIGHAGPDSDKLTLQVFAEGVPSWQEKLVPARENEDQERYWVVPEVNFDIDPEAGED